MSLLAVSMNSYGPYVCDCVKAMEKGDSSIKKACKENFRLKDISDANCK